VKLLINNHLRVVLGTEFDPIELIITAFVLHILRPITKDEQLAFVELKSAFSRVYQKGGPLPTLSDSESNDPFMTVKFSKPIKHWPLNFSNEDFLSLFKSSGVGIMIIPD